MLSFEEAGQSGGTPIVLVHGWCCNRRHMTGLFEHLSKSHHVFAVDLPGHGQTPLDGIPALFEAFAASLCGFLTSRSLSRVIFAGHSLGGILGVLAAGQQPERVSAVVNLDGASPMTALAREKYEQLFVEIELKGFRPVVARFLSESFFLPHERGAVSQQIIADMLSRPEDLAYGLVKQFPILDAEKTLAACHAPILYIGGSYPRFDESQLKKLRPQAWVARVAVSGHFVQVFALPQVVAMIERFVDWCESLGESASARS